MRETREDTIALVEDQQLLVHTRRDESIVRIKGREGLVSLTIRVTGEGTVLSFEGADLAIKTDGDLVIQAQRLALHGREQLVLSSEADAAIRVDGELEMTARAQRIHAELGDVDVKANDDIKLDGERIRMNC